MPLHPHGGVAKFPEEKGGFRGMRMFCGCFADVLRKLPATRWREHPLCGYCQN